MTKIYVAGPLTPTGKENHAIEFLNNVRAGIRISTQLVKCGFAPYCPMLDFQYFLCLPDLQTISAYEIKQMSIAWLLACDAVYLLADSEGSEGCKAECIIARANKIPIFSTLHELMNHFK